ncbi:MAG: hypothetical protein Q4C42_11095 [Clostridia bacterium]|nr:hypothetical protein [Clostridia bacterium]
MDEIKLEKIKDETLENVSGGRSAPSPVYQDGYAFQFDDLNRPIRWRTYDGKFIWHYECPVCKLFMHEGSHDYIYCDPCDKWFYFDKDYVVWDVYDGRGSFRAEI